MRPRPGGEARPVTQIGHETQGGYGYFLSDEAILRFLALPDELKLRWVWEMNALLAQAPPETRRLHELFRRGEI